MQLTTNVIILALSWRRQASYYGAALSKCAVDNERYQFGFIMGTSFLSWEGLSECAVHNERYHFGFVGDKLLVMGWGLSECAVDNEHYYFGFIMGTSFLSWEV